MGQDGYGGGSGTGSASGSGGGSRLAAPWPAAPGAGATIVLFTTHNRNAGGAGALSTPSIPGLSALLLDGLEFVWLRNDQAAAANAIRVYARDDTGTWRETDVKDDNGAATVGASAPQTVGVLGAGTERRWLLECARYSNGVCVEYTAGGTGPTNWNGVITAHLNVEAITR